MPENERCPGDRVRALREQAGLSQDQLAVQAGIGTATVRRIESNRFDPRLSTLEALARALAVDVNDLLGRAS